MREREREKGERGGRREKEGGEREREGGRGRGREGERERGREGEREGGGERGIEGIITSNHSVGSHTRLPCNYRKESTNHNTPTL